MKRGKRICSQLKAVRRQIADENNIPLNQPECTHKGECRGTCPRCEAEVRYLEQALSQRLSLGWMALVAGLTLTLAACGGGNGSTVTTDKQLSEATKEDDEMVESVVFTFPEEDASFPGGEEALYQFLNEHIHYPDEARKEGIEGKVYVRFIVNTDSTISDAVIKRDIGGGCGEEVLRVLKEMPKWIPAKNEGKVVRAEMTVPVTFPPEED